MTQESVRGSGQCAPPVLRSCRSLGWVYHHHMNSPAVWPASAATMPSHFANVPEGSSGFLRDAKRRWQPRVNPKALIPRKQQPVLPDGRALTTR